MPAKKEVNEAGIKIEETKIPWMVEERGPKESRKVGMVVIGPMQPVSKPKRSPPTEMRMEHRMYGAGSRIVIAFILIWLWTSRTKPRERLIPKELSSSVQKWMEQMVLERRQRREQRWKEKVKSAHQISSCCL